jgi:hypothetical protein
MPESEENMKHKAMIAAGLLTLQAVISPIAIANFAQGQPAGEVTGFVVPSEVGANEPFTFAATGVVEGEVISVQTVDGEVVQAKKADKHGRVFLAAGLAAGAYILSTKGGKGTSKIDVQPPRTLPGGSELTIPQLPGKINAKQGLNLTGEGMSPNAADMVATINGKQYPALAGTATEMKTGPLPSSACGAGPVEIKNTKTGDTSMLDNVVCYELSAKLGRQKLVGGEQTALEFTFKPANLTALVEARILSGPVSFAGGVKEKVLEVIGGAAKLPLVADPAGQGPFRVAYDIHDVLGAGRVEGTAKAGDLRPGGPVGGQIGKPGTEPTENKERCPLTKHIRDEATGWKTSEKTVPDADNPGKTKTVYIATRTVRCSIHKSCTKIKGHGGDCAFTGKSRCKDHETTETREYGSADARKDGMKDTKIPEGMKYP